MKPKKPACKDCKYSKPVNGYSATEFTFRGCLRYPPTPTENEFKPAWPIVEDDDWCGEFARR